MRNGFLTFKKKKVYSNQTFKKKKVHSNQT